MADLRSCDVCTMGYRSGSKRGPSGAVRRYQLRRYYPLGAGEKPQNVNNPYQGRYESAGSIDLCDGCWDLIGKPRLAPNKKPKR